MTRKAVLLLPLLLASCVSVAPDAPIKTVVRAGQRTLVLAFAAPSPWVTSADSNVESAAKFLPGLGQALESAQFDRDLQYSQQLRPYMAHWDAQTEFSAALSTALAAIAYPGEWLAPGPDSETPPAELKRFNAAGDSLEWRKRFFDGTPAEGRSYRNYAKLLSLDDALILEVNFLPGLTQTSEGGCSPWVEARSRLYRGGTLRLLWSHEDRVESLGTARTLNEFMARPDELIGYYRGGVQQLAGKVASELQKSVQAQVAGAQQQLPGTH
jgi:hypothetical protein